MNDNPRPDVYVYIYSGPDDEIRQRWAGFVPRVGDLIELEDGGRVKAVSVVIRSPTKLVQLVEVYTEDQGVSARRYEGPVLVKSAGGKTVPQGFGG